MPEATVPEPPSLEVTRTGLTLAVSGTAEPGAEVAVRTTLGLGTRTTTAAADGSWGVRFGLLASLDGTLEVSATQTVGGRTSAAASRRLTL